MMTINQLNKICLSSIVLFFHPKCQILTGACHSEHLGPNLAEVKVVNMAASVQRSVLLRKLLFNSSFRPNLLSLKRSLEVCI